MMLASHAEIREQLGFDDMTDINDAIQASLRAATAVLAAKLSTPFERGTFIDTYYALEPGYENGQAFSTTFRLSRGFVVSVTSVKAAATLELLGGTDASDITAVALMSATDKEKGVFTDYTTRFTRSFVRAEYVAGFEADASNPDMFNLEQVPLWLQEAAKLHAMITLAGSPPVKQADIQIDTKTLNHELSALLSTRIRYTPTALLTL